MLKKIVMLPDVFGERALIRMNSLQSRHSGCNWNGVGEQLLYFRIKRKIKVVSVTLCLMITHQMIGFTQFNTIQFEHLSKRHGLPHTHVNAIFQDSDGFIWFGTASGLAKYDGYEFDVFEHLTDDVNGLTANDILSLFQSQTGQIWIGTNGGGVNVYDPLENSFQHHVHDPSDSTSISGDIILSMLEDSEGIIWIGTDGEGLCSYDPKNKTFTRYYSSKEDVQKLNSKIIMDIYQDKDGRVWIGTVNGLFEYRKDTGKFQRYLVGSHGNSLIDFSVNAIVEDMFGNLWVGTESGDIYLFDRQRGSFSFLDVKVNKEIEWYKDGVVSLFADSYGLLWIGTWDGLIRYDIKNKSFDFHHHIEMEPYSICDGSVVCMYKDRSGVMWLGTADGGVSKFDYRKTSFHHEYSRHYEEGGLSNKLITAIATDTSGDLWVGTTYGLNLLKSGSQTYEVFLPDEEDPTAISSFSINTIFIDREGTVWIGTDGGGLNRWDESKQSFYRYISDPTDTSKLNNGSISSITQDSSGNIWIATFDYGLNILNPETNVFRRVEMKENDPNTLFSDNVNTVYRDKNDNIWVGTSDGGLDRYDEENDSFIHYGIGKDRNKRLHGNSIFTIHDGGNGIYWIGTDYGLNRFNLKDGSFILISKKDGLSGTTVYGILEDKLGCLWLSTNNGLSKYDKKADKIQNYDVTDGLQGNEFRMGAFHMSHKGELFFGGNNGYNRFYPRNILENTHIPQVAITDFKVFNVSQKFESSLVHIDEIKLTHEDNFFSFQFAALDYSSPTRNQLAYLLKGVDKDWVYTQKNRNASYTNIDPGKYEFKVKASNNHGVWNEEGKTIKLIITPPFWFTWWFRALVALLLVMGVTFIYLWRMYKTKEDRRILEKKIEQATKEITSQKLVIQNRAKELESKNKTITAQAKELAAYNEALNNLNGKLEQRVLERTTALVVKNKVLSEYAFINSHELRKPVSNILGLIQLLDFDMDEASKREITEVLKIVAKNLDDKVMEIQNRLK